MARTRAPVLNTRRLLPRRAQQVGAAEAAHSENDTQDSSHTELEESLMEVELQEQPTFLVSDTISFVSAIPKNTHMLRLNSHFTVEQPTRPNAWHRFWQRVLLGWSWEPL